MKTKAGMILKEWILRAFLIGFGVFVFYIALMPHK